MNGQEHLETTAAGRSRSAETARSLIRKAKQATRRRFSSEDKIRILMEGIRGEIAVAELCRREGIHPTVYYKWLKDFMAAGKARNRYRIVDCGKDCPLPKLMEAIEKEQPLAVGISGLITHIIPQVRQVKDLLRLRGLEQVKVMASRPRFPETPAR